jgi:hypothetical protein
MLSRQIVAQLYSTCLRIDHMNICMYVGRFLIPKGITSYFHVLRESIVKVYNLEVGLVRHSLLKPHCRLILVNTVAVGVQVRRRSWIHGSTGGVGRDTS